MTVTRTYVGEPGRYYPELGVTPDKGDAVTFDTADQVPDDGRWKVPTARRKAAKKATRLRARKTAPAPTGDGEPSTPDATSAPAELTEES